MLSLSVLVSILVAACGVDAPSDDTNPGGKTDDPTQGGSTTLEYSHSICGKIDGYRSQLLAGAWSPGRSFAVALPAPRADLTVTSIEYSVQVNLGGSAPIGLAHTAWLFTGDETGPKGEALATYDVPAASNDGEHRAIAIAAGKNAPVIAANATPYVVIDVTPTGVEGNSLVIDQCHTSNDPTGAYLFFAPEHAAPFSAWTEQEPYFTSYVPDLRIKGTL